ncbi:hypothetical protein TUM20984_38660 [Mycobacterium antarcticum]|nr:hypothetical protein TUM20984_38660 [Mycolicibacterium sp. TUM20984]
MRRPQRSPKSVDLGTFASVDVRLAARAWGFTPSGPPRVEVGTVSFLKLVVSFAPWIAFLILARDTMHRVEIGLVVALGLTVLTRIFRPR